MTYRARMYIKLIVLLLIVLVAYPRFMGYARNTWAPKTFHELFYNTNQTWGKNTWLGIPAAQNPNDVWITQEIITETKPDIIVDSGTFRGGSALIWALIQREVNPNGKVITIDIEDYADKAKQLPLFKERVESKLGSSTDPNIFEDIRAQAEGKRVLVVLDSAHDKAHVLKELELYSTLLDVGEYLITQDTNVNGHPVVPDWGPGPYEAVEEFLSKNKNFERDLERERLIFTMHPGGWLKRVR